MRCCGTLEFLCEFHDQCHQTQHKFQEKGLKKIPTDVPQVDDTGTVREEDQDEESDKENVIPPCSSRNSTVQKFIDSSNTSNTSLNQSTCNTIVDGTGNSLDNQSEQLEPVQKTRSHDTVLSDITGQHSERTKTPATRELFSVFTKGMKRQRKSPVVIRNNKKKRRAEQKKNTDTIEVNIINTSADATKEIRKEIEKDHHNTLEKIETNNEEMTEKLCKDAENDLENKNKIPPVTSEQEKTFKYKKDNNKLTEKASNQNNRNINHNSTVLTEENGKSDNDKNSKYDKPNTLNKSDDNSKLEISESNEDNFTPNISLSQKSESISVSDIKKSRNLLRQSKKSTTIIDNDDDDDDDDNNDERDDSKSTGQKRKSLIYGKISDLMSKEQKEAIEKYYTMDMSVINESTVKKHYYINDKKQIICKFCKAIYPRVDKCHVHIWGHLDMKPYRCNACNFATVTVTNIRCHIRKSHLKIKPFECHICDKRFVTAVLLEEHINTHTGARPYQCKLCDFSSASRQVLTYHNTSHKSSKDITCDICKKEFYSKGRMRAHMLTHNKDKTMMCKYCSHHFTTTEALQRHYENIHSTDYVCNTCGKRTKSRKALHNHQNVHLKAKYKCPICPNVYKSSHILKEHLLKHEGIRKYKCDVCNKDFAQQSHLAAHKAVHSEKRYFCPGCQRAFNRHDNMKMHTKRCDIFLSNPDLKNLITRRPTRKSTSNNDIDADDNNDSNEIFDKSNKTDNLNNELTKNSSFRIGEVDIVPIKSVSVPVNISAHAQVTVTESVLGLECF